MSYHATDAEQVEQLRKWWKEYGWSTVLGIILAIVIVVGWQVYRRHQLHQAENASLIYATMMSSSYSGNLTSATSAAKALIKDYHTTVYSDLAGLWLAKNAVNQKHYQAALPYLEAVQTKGHMATLRQLAALRRAEIYLQMQDSDQALAALGQVYDKGFSARIDELKGDIYWQMHDVANARKWYEFAKNAYEKAGLPSPFLAMKLANVPMKITQ